MRLRLILLALLASAAAACGASKGGRLPVDSPAMAFEAKDANELAGIDEDADSDDSDEGEGPEVPETPTPAPAPSH